MPIVRTYVCEDCFHRMEVTLEGSQWNAEPPQCPRCNEVNQMRQEFKPVAIGGSNIGKATKNAETIAQQISIEAAQPRLDLGVLDDLAGKTIILGVIDLGDPAVETAEQVAARIRAGLARVPPARLIPAPDCGMKYLPRDTAFGKLSALSAAARAVRTELSP